MKPRTKFEQIVVKANKRIKGINLKAVDWADKTMIKHIAFRTKNGVAVCSDCGHKFIHKGSEKYIHCQECGRMLEIKDTRERTNKQSAYFSTLHIQDGIQVQRVYKLKVIFNKGKTYERFVTEVCRLWINKEGKTAVTGLKRTLGYYVDSFNYGSEIELRQMNDVFSHISDTYIYPKFRLIPELKRNGLKHFKFDLHPFELMSRLLKDTRVETLLKGGNKRAFIHFMKNPSNLDLCWNSYKIALRHGYKISNIQLWCDTIKLLDRCGKDIHSVRYICPQDLMAEHDRWNKKVMEIEKIEFEQRQIEWEKQRLEREKKNIEQQLNRESEFAKMKSCYFGIVIEDNDIEISVLNSVRAHLEEGTAMCHCVFSNRYYENPDSLILSAHDKEGNRIETIEFSLTLYKVIQCHGKYNKDTELHNRIISLVNDNAFRFIEAKMKTA